MLKLFKLPKRVFEKRKRSQYSVRLHIPTFTEYSPEIYNYICPIVSPKSDVYKKFDDDFTIINNCDNTMKHPVINLNIKENCEAILSNNKLVTFDRGKPMYAIVAGMGRGKTRLLVEMDKYLKDKYGMDEENSSQFKTISIAITFNRYWLDILRYSGNINIDYSIAIVARIISIYYKLSLDDVHDRIESILNSIKTYRNEDAKNIIKDCIMFIVNQANEVKNGRDVTNAVVMVDEAKRVEVEFGTSKVHDILRQALLNKKFLKEDGNQVVIDLIMASLAISSTGVSNSFRPIIALTTPEYLDSEEVLKKWIPAYIPVKDLNLKREDDLKLKSMIASISSIPRLIEYMIVELKDSDMKRIDHRKLYTNVVNRMNQYYNFLNVTLPAKYAKHLLFAEKVQVDDVIMNLIEKSVFTNSIKYINKQTYIKPSTSIIITSNLDITTNNYAKPIIKAVKELNDDLYSMTGGIHSVGRPLEIITNGLIGARLQVLKQLALEGDGYSYCSLWELLQIKDGSSIEKVDEFYGRLDSNKIVINAIGKSTFQLPYSYQGGIDAFIDSSNFFVDPDQSSSYIDFTLDPLEFADGAWLFKLKNNKPFALFVDCKSSMIQYIIDAKRRDNDKTKKMKNQIKDLPGNGKKISYLLTIIDRIKEMDVDVVEGSLLDALKSGSYLYVYLNTKKNEETFKVKRVNVLQMGENDSSQFLSFFKDYYQLHCVASPRADEEIKRKMDQNNQ